MTNTLTYWQSITSAPKDGQMIITMWKDTTVFASWFDPEGWRVIMFGRNGDYAIHGNYKPFEPEFWLPHTTDQISKLTIKEAE